MSVALFSAMAATESLPRSPFASDHISPSPLQKPIPIITTSTSANPIPPPDPMEITPTSTSMPPPNSSPPSESKSERKNSGDGEHTIGTGPTNGYATEAGGNGGNQPLGAAAAASQPTKVVQTAFIHKLYNMLEDPTIQHLISWSNSNESFVMSPSTEFSKVLAQYFKHTNISSFVRQLNMYGFHKVSDVFHNGAPDNTLWEFRHGNGSFKRGDLTGLKEIKRRASRHTLIHRDSFSTTAAKSLAPAQPIPPPSEMPVDPGADRLTMLEHTVWEMHSRLARTEDTVSYLKGRCQMLSEGLLRCHRWNQDLAGYLNSAVPETDTAVHRNISMMQQDIGRQTDILRNGDMPDLSPESRPPGHPIFTNHLQDHGPPSPRQHPVSDINQRRPSHPLVFDSRPQPASTLRGLAPHLSISPRRYGSIGTANPSNTYSPSSSRAPPPPPPPPSALSIAHPQPQHPLATVTSPTSNLSRRHTAADIRSHGWDHSQGPPIPSPFASAQPSTPQWPSSPARGGEDNRAIRDALANYELGRGSQSHARTPPPNDPAAAVAGTGPESAWQVPGSRFPGYGRAFGGNLEPNSGGPPTRRSSMASNLHGLLNPAGESLIEEDEGIAAKRKRVA